MNQKQLLPLQQKQNGNHANRQTLSSICLLMMVSMLVQALYNIVTQHLCSKTVRECSYCSFSCLPVTGYASIAVATGTGVGMNALLSRALGAKN